MRSRLVPARPPGFARTGRLCSVAKRLTLASLIGISLYARPASAANDEDDDSKLADEPASSSSKSDEGADEKHPDNDEKSGSSLNQKSRFQIAFYSTLYSSSKLSFAVNRQGQVVHGSITETSFGPSGNPLTLELGYALSDSFVLGVLLELGTADTTTHTYGYQNVQSTGRFLVGPRAEYSFGDRVRPFISGVAGFTTVPQSGDLYSVSLTGVEFAAGLGLRWFIADRFSIDPCVRGTWGVGAGRVKDSLNPEGANATGNLLSGAALLGISGWI